MRPIWSGAISFGLIYIPVKLFSASEAQELDFDMLRRGDLCGIRYVRVCRETGEEVPWDDIVRGYEYRKGDYVVLEDEDFKKVRRQRSQTIEIVNFVSVEEIPSQYYEKPYFLEPDKGAEKVYALLREALRRSKRVGLARFVLRTREHLALLKTEGDVILLNQMRFSTELRDPGDLKLPGDTELADREVDLAVQLIDQLTENWKPDSYRDTYVDELKAMIDAKVEGREVAEEEEQPIPIEVTDLFSRLSESLEMARKGSSPADEGGGGKDKK